MYPQIFVLKTLFSSLILVSLTICCFIFVTPYALFLENCFYMLFRFLFVSCNKCIYLGYIAAVDYQQLADNTVEKSCVFDTRD